jgi:transcriptional regulator with XRE-family HTH domain
MENQQLSDIIKEGRQQAGLTQEALAEKSGLNLRTTEN